MFKYFKQVLIKIVTYSIVSAFRLWKHPRYIFIFCEALVTFSTFIKMFPTVWTFFNFNFNVSIVKNWNNNYFVVGYAGYTQF